MQQQMTQKLSFNAYYHAMQKRKLESTCIMSSVTISSAVTTGKTTDGVSYMAIKQQPNKIQRSNLRQKLSFNAYYDAMQKRKLESTCIMSSVTISPAVTTSKTTDGVSYMAIKQ
jgi:hypothetical protein